jgi:hypothetical protein
MSKKYPKDWFCSLCHEPFSKHVKIGTPNENGGIAPAELNWCFSYNTRKGSSSTNKEHNWSFEPVDNLTQIELLAKRKGITGKIFTIKEHMRNAKSTILSKIVPLKE